MLIDIATAASNSSIDLHISIYVTCLCDPEAVPAIPNSVVMLSRPSVHGLLASFINLPCEREDSIETQSDEIQEWKHSGGGVAVCASGPESMTREAQNAVARIGLTASMDVGGIVLHTELFSL
jgi:ferric-chelate reductase